ncbi:MAG: hypothetical protein ACRCVW_02215 [Brevinema sp.]
MNLHITKYYSEIDKQIKLGANNEQNLRLQFHTLNSKNLTQLKNFITKPLSMRDLITYHWTEIRSHLHTLILKIINVSVQTIRILEELKHNNA